MAGPVPAMSRARDEMGRFIADDPATPDVDEAWVPAQPQDNGTTDEVAV